MKGKINNFKEKTINQIRLWAWAAAVLPISGLAGLFFIWRFGADSWLGLAMITGETVMFTVAVVWWWWALYTMKTLVKQWDTTRENVKEVLNEVSEIKTIVKNTADQDK